MNKLRWRLNRLRLMGVGEIVWRCRRALPSWLEQARHGLLRCSTNQAAHQPCGKAWIDDLPVQFAPAPYLRHATRTAAGRFGIFAMQDVFLGFPPPWNRDPTTSASAPLDFGKRLDYRDAALVGDIKYLWEPNRHYELFGLAQAYHLTKAQTWLRACHGLLESWFDACPYPYGQAWSSALENVVRLVTGHSPGTCLVVRHRLFSTVMPGCGCGSAGLSAFSSIAISLPAIYRCIHRPTII